MKKLALYWFALSVCGMLLFAEVWALDLLMLVSFVLSIRTLKKYYH